MRVSELILYVRISVVSGESSLMLAYQLEVRVRSHGHRSLLKLFKC